MARDGREARDVVDRRGVPFDLLISDVVMPRMNGNDLCEELRRRHPKIRLLFIFISGHPHVDDPSGGSSRGFGAPLLMKPFRRTALLEKLHELMGTG